MIVSGLVEMARVLQTTPNYLLGYTYSDDDFLSEALSLLEGIKDETIKKVLLAQIKSCFCFVKNRYRETGTFSFV